ncbi:glycoside hydrolase family 65 protein [Gandjariella thermophila]|uniref:Glycosyl hydrolase n=1 Tax=Gandjariella thermophila TaxID=1931992 RepID=A0A4D4JBA8_9PSEU|nr:glycoside hydrolase family 65 protein [Gandjariella thermophila]GDY32854.1 glycosyl hydrolase [Gandjariella thermophila]
MTAARQLPGYEVAPWELRWRWLDLDALRKTESTFALSNGHIGFRGSFEEGEPRGLPGTYLNGFYERRPLPYAEAGYGYPEDGQTVVNVTDGKIIRLLVEDEPVDMRYGSAPNHERVLDFRSGTLRRHTEWISPTGRQVRITSERLVSFTQRAIGAIHYEVEPLDGPAQLVVQSELLANEPIERETDDPRVAAVLENALVSDFHTGAEYHAALAHHTRRSGLRMAAAMDHEIDAPGDVWTENHTSDDLGRLTVAAEVPRGQKLRLTKYVAYGWSSQRSTQALLSQVNAALAGARLSGWQGLLDEQRAFLDDFWDSADVEIDGDAELQQAVRFALFHVLQAGARGETRAIPAKGLTGPGYDGHAFWDTETFVLPLLTYTVPDAARNALQWRHSTLDKARKRAVQLGQAGAAFPWRSINGEECSGYWPAGTAAFHVNADVADATARYLAATGDKEFEAQYGLELLVETARLWSSLGHHDAHGRFRIDGVTGPDEYTAIVDNNTYTNLMAQRNLREAATRCEMRPELARELGVDEEETARWRDAADRMVVPWDDMLQVHPQSEGFTRHAYWDFAGTPPENYPLLLHYPYFDLYRKQVIKQADLVLAMWLRGDAFTPEQKARNVAYYEPLTVRDSSLSSCIQAVLNAEVGHLELAYDYFAEAALADLHDLYHNVHQGLHIASLAGSWIVAVAGFGGMRDHGGKLTFAPRLPPELGRIAFRMCFAGSRICVTIRRDEVTYQLVRGEPVHTSHHGEAIALKEGEPVTLPIPPAPQHVPPRQPAGRAPARRRPYPVPS